uniref:Uncharacterized protein n=1 Tax=Anguilla anguilla TaxID=7936 RepID=A0A0E9U752_ANGAN
MVRSVDSSTRGRVFLLMPSSLLLPPASSLAAHWTFVLDPFPVNTI